MALRKGRWSTPEDSCDDANDDDDDDQVDMEDDDTDAMQDAEGRAIDRDNARY